MRTALSATAAPTATPKAANHRRSVFSVAAPVSSPLGSRRCSRASVVASGAPAAAPPSPSSSSSAPNLASTGVPAPGAAAAASPSSEGAPTTKTPWWKKHDNMKNIVDVNGVEELLEVFASAEDKLVVVDVYAQWCNACRAISPKVFALAKENPDDLVLAKLDFDANKQVARALGVKALPSFAMFRGADGKLDIFSAGPARAGLLREKVERYGAPRCVLSGVIGGGSESGSPELRELLSRELEEQKRQAPQ